MVEKKKFFELTLPLINKKINLLASSEKDLIGRSVNIDLTRELRGKSLEITFKIDFDKEIKISPYRVHLLGYFIRRIMRTSTDYVEDSFSAECKNAILRIKPFLITRKKVSGRVKKALREKAKETIAEVIKEKSYEDLFSELLSGAFQKALSLDLKKIYPLAFCDIRDAYVENLKQELAKEEKVK